METYKWTNNIYTYIQYIQNNVFASYFLLIYNNQNNGRETQLMQNCLKFFNGESIDSYAIMSPSLDSDKDTISCIRYMQRK